MKCCIPPREFGRETIDTLSAAGAGHLYRSWVPTNCTCQWKWCKDATGYPTRADDAVAKLYMSLEGTTTDELYHQLKDLRCNDSKEEVWALAEKQAALPKSRRLQVRTWHALETNWQWNPTRMSASAGSNTPVRAVHCIALPALFAVLCTFP